MSSYEKEREMLIENYETIIEKMNNLKKIEDGLFIIE